MPKSPKIRCFTFRREASMLRLGGFSPLAFPCCESLLNSNVNTPYSGCVRRSYLKIPIALNKQWATDTFMGGRRTRTKGGDNIENPVTFSTWGLLGHCGTHEYSTLQCYSQLLLNRNVLQFNSPLQPSSIVPLSQCFSIVFCKAPLWREKIF